MSTLLKVGFSGYDVKPRCLRSNANISNKIHFFFWENVFGDTRQLCEKNEPILDRFWGGGAR